MGKTTQNAEGLNRFSYEPSKFKETLTVAVVDYLNKYGIDKFMDEYYNLLGNKEIAEITEKNLDLARVLGLPVSGNESIGLKTPRTKRATILQSSGEIRRQLIKVYLVDIFSNIKSKEISDIQRNFLYWHFLSGERYLSHNLDKGENKIIIGFDSSASIAGESDFTFYVFGLIGCTAIFAESSDGSVHISHCENRGDINGPLHTKLQMDLLKNFLKEHPDAKVWVIGYWAKNVAQLLSETVAGINEISYHSKDRFLDSNYSLMFLRENGKTYIKFDEKNISNDFLHSMYPNAKIFTNKPKWPNKVSKFKTQGTTFCRFSQLYPRNESQFSLVEFEVFKRIKIENQSIAIEKK